MYGHVQLLVFLGFAVVIRAADLMPGGPVEQKDPGSADIKDLAEKAVAEYNRLINSLYLYILVEVLEVKTQVLSGVVNYDLKLLIALNKNCRKGKTCSGNKPIDPPIVLKADVLVQPEHENEPQITFPHV